MTGALKTPMITDPMIEELVDILFDVQRRFHYTFDLQDAYDILTYTIRKCELNGKGKDYIPILYENELRDFLIGREINLRGAINLCALSADEPRATPVAPMPQTLRQSTPVSTAVMTS